MPQPLTRSELDAALSRQTVALALLIVAFVAVVAALVVAAF